MANKTMKALVKKYAREGLWLDEVVAREHQYPGTAWFE